MPCDPLRGSMVSATLNIPLKFLQNLAWPIRPPSSCRSRGPAWSYLMGPAAARLLTAERRLAASRRPWLGSIESASPPPLPLPGSWNRRLEARGKLWRLAVWSATNDSPCWIMPQLLSLSFITVPMKDKERCSNLLPTFLPLCRMFVLTTSPVQ